MHITAYTKEFGKNLQIAYPVMLGQLGHVLVGLADNIMVGQLGAAPLAAVSLGNSLVFIALSLGIGFSFAITPLIAEADGAQDVETGKSYFHHGIIMCGINGILLFLLLLLAKPIFISSGSTARGGCSGHTLPGDSGFFDVAAHAVPGL